MIKFGPSGNSDLFYAQGFKASVEAPRWLKNRGLDAYEYSFSRGFAMSDIVAQTLGKECKENGIEISVHAPYYINFASTDEKLIEKSFNYILECLRYLRLLGGTRCIFHPGSCGKQPREEAFARLKENISKLVEKVKAAGYTEMKICPETMGKSLQLGTYEEIAQLCAIDECLLPTIDFGHINALTQGGLKTEEDFERVIKCFIDKIGIERTRKMHVHFSKIEYGEKGEIKHLTLEDKIYGPEFENLAKIIKKYDLEPVIISESKGCQAEDANILKEIYKNTI